MSYTYSYSINSLKLKDETNHEGATLARAVYQTYWTITGTNSAGQSASWSGATPLSAANVPAGSFVAFDDLTEETVTGWIQSIVEADGAYLAHITERLDEEIEREFGQSEEIEAKALPWAPVVDAEADADAEPDPASEAAPD
jgi:hypothetical protein